MATHIVNNVSRVVDAPPTWFGPHVKGVDDAAWNNASYLPNKPPQGLYRHVPSVLTTCVLDADYRLDAGMPFFLVSRGTLGNVSYVPQEASNLYCYAAPFSLAIGSSLDDVDIVKNVSIRSHFRIANDDPHPSR